MKGANQKFYIGVHGYGGDAEFNFNIFIDRVQIQDGYPQMGDSKTGKYTYFEFVTSGARHVNERNFNTFFRRKITIGLTPLNGDPDLYVSTTTATPTSTNYQWWAAMPGFDVITIDPTDPKYIVC